MLNTSTFLSALAILASSYMAPAIAQSQEDSNYYFRYQIPVVVATDAAFGLPEDDDENEEAGPTGCDNIGCLWLTY